MGLFPRIRRFQPMIDPVFLAVMLACLLSFALAVSSWCSKSRTIVVGRRLAGSLRNHAGADLFRQTLP